MFANEIIKACCCLRRSTKSNFQLNATENLISLDSGHIGTKDLIFANMFLFAIIKFSLIHFKVKKLSF